MLTCVGSQRPLQSQVALLRQSTPWYLWVGVGRVGGWVGGWYALGLAWLGALCTTCGNAPHVPAKCRGPGRCQVHCIRGNPVVSPGGRPLGDDSPIPHHALPSWHPSFAPPHPIPCPPSPPPTTPPTVSSNCPGRTQPPAAPGWRPVRCSKWHPTGWHSSAAPLGKTAAPAAPSCMAVGEGVSAWARGAGGGGG